VEVRMFVTLGLQKVPTFLIKFFSDELCRSLAIFRRQVKFSDKKLR
jgi:hypothetical protein